MIDPLRHLPMFRPHSGPVLDLPSVTSITVDDRSDSDTLSRLASITRWHRRFMRFGREIIVSGSRPDVDGVEWFKLDRFDTNNPLVGYSRWCQYEMRNFIKDGFAMLWQSDGFALQPLAWSGEFFKYDYLGILAGWTQDGSGGNGGFTLRSKKFCEDVARLPDCGNIPEDWYFCAAQKPVLEKMGIRFGASIQKRWGTEWFTPHAECFGFHGKHNLDQVARFLNRCISTDNRVTLASGAVWNGSHITRAKNPDRNTKGCALKKKEGGIDRTLIIPNKPGWKSYNNGIVNRGGKLLMCHRSARGIRGIDYNETYLSYLDGSFHMTGTKLLANNAEDGRISYLNGKLHVACTAPKPFPHMRVFRLNDDLEVELDKEFPNTRKHVIDKNWQFFTSEGRVCCVYEYDPFTVKFFDQDLNIYGAKKRASVKWAYGEIRGGTPPLLIGDRFYMMVHSRLSDALYVNGLLVFDRTFNVLSLEKAHIDDYNIVYPCGLAPFNGSILLSYGVDDCACKIREFSLAIPPHGSMR